MKVLAISPTYNESQNVIRHIDKVMSLSVNIDLLIIDDSSPDGTGKIVKSMEDKYSRLHLITRDSKQGLGTAYISGFKWAIENNFEYIVQIDADMSHDSNVIPDMLELTDRYDFIIGSRYINGVNVINWPLRRLILSYFANTYASSITGLKIKDLTSGYNCFNINILNKINYKTISSEGYSFQIELKYLSYVNGFKLFEFPIIFNDRTVGESKMSKRIIFEAIFKVITLKLRRIFRII